MDCPWVHPGAEKELIHRGWLKELKMNFEGKFTLLPACILYRPDYSGISYSFISFLVGCSSNPEWKHVPFLICTQPSILPWTLFHRKTPLETHNYLSLFLLHNMGIFKFENSSGLRRMSNMRVQNYKLKGLSVCLFWFNHTYSEKAMAPQLQYSCLANLLDARSLATYGRRSHGL